jgi:hypothetical protein
MALAIPPPNDRKRVKVYELRDNDWFDRGTGFCTGHIVNVRKCSPLSFASLPPPARLSCPTLLGDRAIAPYSTVSF